MLKYVLINIKKSPIKSKKWRACFVNMNNGRYKHTDFGGAGYTDYTMGATNEQRRNYRNRHRNDRLNDPISPGALSWYILWGNSRTRSKNIEQYKRKFKMTKTV